MKHINAQRIGIVQRIRALGPEFAEDADTLEAYLMSSGEKRFTIANAGTTNTGKSTLFNAFLGKEEAFRTADVRETTVCRDIAWGPRMVLVDTPGCGSCSAADDREAAKAYRRADLVVFVHNLATGGLKRDEMEVLESVCRYMGEKDFRERTVVVGTRIDCCPGGTAAVNRRECEAQLLSELGARLRFFEVSPKRYFRGLQMAAGGEQDKAKVFFASSGVDSLASSIRAFAGKSGRRGLNRFDGLREKIRSRLHQARAAYERDSDAVKRAKADEEAEIAPIKAEIARLRAA